MYSFVPLPGYLLNTVFVGIDAIREGQHLVLCTSTASGKSLVYNVPILESLLLGRPKNALYLFPTKV